MKELTGVEKHYLRVLLRKKTPIKDEARNLYTLWKEAKRGNISSKDDIRKIDNDLRTLISHAFVFLLDNRQCIGCAHERISKMLESVIERFNQTKAPTDFEKGKYTMALDIYEILAKESLDT